MPERMRSTRQTAPAWPSRARARTRLHVRLVFPQAIASPRSRSRAHNDTDSPGDRPADGLLPWNGRLTPRGGKCRGPPDGRDLPPVLRASMPRARSQEGNRFSASSIPVFCADVPRRGENPSGLSIRMIGRKSHTVKVR
jgi:hypothetical protein